MEHQPITLSIVVPCYNEEKVLPQTRDAFLKLFKRLVESGKISCESRICFVDDGSHDQTWSLIVDYELEQTCFQGIKLSRNFGHQNAVLAGLFSASGDVVVSIDADLQDDINVIEEMVDRYYAGHEVVYGVRRKRNSDTFFKRFTAEMFYKMMQILGCDIVNNHADFRLLSRRAIETLKEFSEVNLFLRGIVPLLGFRSSEVYFERKKRSAGKSKYPLKKMLRFAWEGITSFSVVPLKLITLLGFIIFATSSALAGWALISKFYGQVVAGWVSTVLPIFFLGGVQMLSLGIIGEYVGKLYREAKRRPRYIVDQDVGFESEVEVHCESRSC